MHRSVFVDRLSSGDPRIKSLPDWSVKFDYRCDACTDDTNSDNTTSHALGTPPRMP